MDFDYIKQGDCLELMKQIPDGSIDVSFTSPPYNRIRNDTYKHYDDNKSDYLKMLIDVTDEMLRVTKKYVIINIQCNHSNKSDFYKYLGKYHDKINGVTIWKKTNPQPSNNYNKEKNTRSVTNAFEYFIFLKDGKSFVSYGKEQTYNTIESTVNSLHFEGHGAVMKKEICEYMIQKFTKENDIVLDCFLGTGTTAVVCTEQNRHYIGFELVPEYFDIASQRLAKSRSMGKQLTICDITGIEMVV